MKLAALFILAFLTLTTPAIADEAGFARYDGGKYGFTFSYPAAWQPYANANTELRAHGLPSVFDVCLTPGPVKTLSCPVVVYVIPQGKFTPPAEGSVLGLEAMESAGLKKDTAWKASVGSPGASPPDTTTSYYRANNGYVYLVTGQGRPDEAPDLVRLLNSFRFSAPN